jgi:sialate O-acetylesterase
LSVGGENNANGNHTLYTCMLMKFIQHLRSIWYTRTNSSTDANFHFGVVQVIIDNITYYFGVFICSQLSTSTNNTDYIGYFPWTRWHQTFDVGYLPNNVIPNTFMAVTLDLRDDDGG